ALSNEAGAQMAAYNDLVKLPPKAAHVTITLP
ncbi:MAG: DotU family type IV/VI secretion system protein, partial [Lysobacteraceae bacterium]